MHSRVRVGVKPIRWHSPKKCCCEMETQGLSKVLHAELYLVFDLSVVTRSFEIAEVAQSSSTLRSIKKDFAAQVFRRRIARLVVLVILDLCTISDIVRGNIVLAHLTG